MQTDKIKEFGIYLQSLINQEVSNSDVTALHTLIKAAKHHNRWFSEEVVTHRLEAIVRLLQSTDFEIFINSIQPTSNPQKIAFVSEEHIPLEEFSNLLTIEVSGHSALYKIGEHNDKLLPYILGLYFKFTRTKPNLIFMETPIRDADVFYFTLRKEPTETITEYTSNKNSIIEVRNQSAAIINGLETAEELELLANDIFSYFGQGAGNVRKIYVPENYDIRTLLPHFEYWQTALEHNAYTNNYQYHQSVFLMNRIEHYDNDFLLLKEDTAMRAPTGVLYYEYYSNQTDSSFKNEKQLPFEAFHSVYKSCPLGCNEKAFGDSANQLLLPSKKLMAIL